MLYPGDFVLSISNGAHDAQDKRVMARIALNALVDPQKFPVDLSEVSKLDCFSRLQARAFLAYMAINPSEYGTWSSRRCESLFDEVQAIRETGDSKVETACM